MGREILLWCGMSRVLEYLEEVEDNFLGLDEGELARMHRDLSEADCIMPFGSGRSFCAIKVGVGPLAPFKVIVCPEDVGFPGQNVSDAAPVLEDRYEKIVLWIASGSGESSTPIYVAQDLAKYIEDTGSKKFSINVITSKSNSTLGRIGHKYGCTVSLQGRTNREVSNMFTTESYRRMGIMGDIFELGALSLLRFETQALIEGSPSERVLEIGREELPRILALIYKITELPNYQRTLDVLEEPHSLFFGGMGTSSGGVASMSAIRFSHIKRAIGDSVYVARGENTPRPRVGDLGILISRSGESPATVEWFKTLRKNDSRVTAVVGQENSTLAREADFPLILGTEYFYVKAAYVLSVLALHLCEKLSSKGHELPEFILRWFHSITE